MRTWISCVALVGMVSALTGCDLLGPREDGYVAYDGYSTTVDNKVHTVYEPSGRPVAKAHVEKSKTSGGAYVESNVPAATAASHPTIAPSEAPKSSSLTAPTVNQ